MNITSDKNISIIAGLEYTSTAQVNLMAEGSSAKISGVLKSKYRCEPTLSLRKSEDGNCIIDAGRATGMEFLGASIDTQKAGLSSGKYRLHLVGSICDSVQKTVY